MATRSIEPSSSDPPPRRRDAGSDTRAGYALVEVLAALFLFSVAGLVIVRGVVSSQGLIRRIVASALETNRLLQAEEVLRRAAARVRLPFWVAEPPEAAGWELSEGAVSGATASGAALRIGYLDGEAGQLLLLERTADGKLRVRTSTDDFDLVLGPFAAMRIEAARDAEGHLRGLTFRFGLESGPAKEAFVVAPFGATGFAPEPPAGSPSAEEGPG